MIFRWDLQSLVQVMELDISGNNLGPEGAKARKMVGKKWDSQQLRGLQDIFFGPMNVTCGYSGRSDG